MAQTSPGSSIPSGDSASVELHNDRGEIEHLQHRIAEDLARLNYPKASLFAVRLAIHEAITNAFVHGHKSLPPTTPVKFNFEVDDRRLAIRIEDQGPGFDPASVPDPTLDDRVESTSGRGLMLIRAYMAKAQYSKGGRCLEMEYLKPVPKA